MFREATRPRFLDQVSRKTVGEYLANRRRGKNKISRATYNKHLTALRAAFNWAIDDGLLKENPCKGIRKLKCMTRKVILSEKECRTLFDVLSKVGARWEVAARLAYYCGMRVQEIAHMTWRSVDLLEGMITVQAESDGWEPKDYETRLLRLEPRTKELLTELRNRTVQEPLMSDTYACTSHNVEAVVVGTRVLGGTNTDAFAKTLRRHIRAACDKAGLPQLPKPVHDLRRSIATLLAQRGVRPYVLQLFMGHSDMDTVTLEYYVDTKKIDAAREAMEAIVNGQNRPKRVTNG